jgi:hypothetical protein
MPLRMHDSQAKTASLTAGLRINSHGNTSSEFRATRMQAYR